MQLIHRQSFSMKYEFPVLLHPFEEVNLCEMEKPKEKERGRQQKTTTN